MTQNQEKKSRKSSIIGLILIGVVAAIIFSSCNSDKSKISKAAYGKFANDIVLNGGDPQFNIDFININGNSAEVGYRLLGGSYKTTATKLNGEWIIK
ncbi:hypothetical protein [Brevibacillus sp. NRS-1366]|uniref:hypothetical protein n=1 Tax=Brevibacillus sp. NRS-1366 TaxID=3233899 RepID=UPI003D201DBF